MAYVEIRKKGKLISRRAIDDGQARKGCKVFLGEVGEIEVWAGQSQTVGEYEVSSFVGPGPEAAEANERPDEAKRLATGAQAPMEGSEDQAGRAGPPSSPPAIEGYEIIAPLGQGGMGTVWKAVDLSTRRHVAIKFLERHRFDSDKAKVRFEREVALAAQLTHPNVARVYASGLHQGIYYYVMELIDGIHLDEFVRQQHLLHREIMRLVAQVCDGVCHAHSLGIVHRDLKPSNILVSRDGRPYIVDFGLARMASQGDYDLTISVEGEIAGTPAYMAPEQAAGRHEQINERTDVYSLGVILYRLCTGHLPHEMKGGRYEVLRRIVEEEIPSPCTHDPTIDRELESLILMALAREPQMRYPSAAALRQDIDNYLQGEALRARSLSRIYRLRKRATKLFRPIGISLLLLALVATSVAVTRYWVGAEQTGDSGAGAEEVRWQPVADIPQCYEEARAAFLGGKMYVVGGRTGHGPEHSCVRTVQAYDPATNTWSVKAPLPEGRAAMELVVLDGCLYALGGIKEAAWWGWPSDSAYRYDPRTATWTGLAPMPIARSNFVAGAFDNKIYAAGGNIHWPNTTDRTDVYDIMTGSWSTVAPMPAPRGGGVGGPWGGRLIVAWGRPDAYSYDRRIFAYEVATDQWTQPASIPMRLFGDEGAHLYDEGDCMYFAGRRETPPYTTWIIRLAPLTGQVWFLSPRSPIARTGVAAACPLPSHEIYLTGGYNLPAHITATERVVIQSRQVAAEPRGQPVPDQKPARLTGTGVLASASNGGNEIQQGVTAGVTGQLVKVGLYVSGGTGTATFFLNKGSPWQKDRNEFSTTIQATKAGWLLIDVSSAKLCFNRGDLFTLGILGSGTAPWYLGTSRDGSAAAALWQQVGIDPPAPQDASLAFRTYVDAYVPPPAAQ